MPLSREARKRRRAKHEARYADKEGSEGEGMKEGYVKKAVSKSGGGFTGRANKVAGNLKGAMRRRKMKKPNARKYNISMA